MRLNIAAETSAPPDSQRDIDSVLNLRAWSALAGIGFSTAKREIAAGRGPRIIKLSPRRRGVRLSDHYAWLDAKGD